MEGSTELTTTVLKELKWNLDGGYKGTLEELNSIYLRCEDSEEMRSFIGTEEERRSKLIKSIKKEKTSAVNLAKVLFIDNERVLQMIYSVLAQYLVKEDFTVVPETFDINSTYEVIESGCTTTYCGRLFLMHCLSKRGELSETHVKKLRKLSHKRNQIMHSYTCYPNCRVDAMFAFNYFYTRDILNNEHFNKFIKDKMDGLTRKSSAFN